MTLNEKQMKFTRMIANLIIYAVNHGYELTFGDAYRDPKVSFPYSHPRSLHKIRLAVDFNVFSGGKYLINSADFQELGEYWESLGGSWGGRFTDGNHFSLVHEGMK